MGWQTIRNIVQHVGSCKLMYENHAFGDGSLFWDEPFVDSVGALGNAGEINHLRSLLQRTDRWAFDQGE